MKVSQSIKYRHTFNEMYTIYTNEDNVEKWWWTTYKHPSHHSTIHKISCNWWSTIPNKWKEKPCECINLEIDPVLKLIWFQDISGG